MNNNRPLSPHLSIHRKVLTAVFSIFHRFTGIFLSLGTLLVVIWICLLSLGADYFFIYEKIASNILFNIILFFWTFSIFYHLINGIRYLYWSFGIGMDMKSVYLSSYVVIFFSTLLTFGIWFFV